MRKRIVFVAGHLLSPSVGSGGDVLFCQIASRIRERRPDWQLVVLAPDFACPQLQAHFEIAIPLATKPSEGTQGSPAGVAFTWFGRLRSAEDALLQLQPDIAHSTGDFFIDVWPVARARRRKRMTWSGVVHHINAPPFRRRNALLVSGVSYALQRASFRALRTAASISVLNETVRSDLVDLRFALERVHVVGAGIEVNRFPIAPVSGRARRAVWINRLEPTKGMFDLPHILQRLPADISIDVIGRGPDVHVDRLRKALERSGVASRCALHGFLSEAQMFDVLRRASAFISCSYEEGWGISIAEALAVGLPCVAYDLPSHREVFGNAIARVPVGDVTAFARAVTIAVDAADSDELRAARHNSAMRYSIDKCAERQEDAFAALLASAGDR